MLTHRRESDRPNQHPGYERDNNEVSTLESKRGVTAATRRRRKVTRRCQVKDGDDG
ncbi:hypothetical protein GBA52_005461 [Prunus armeniaca]|nr:hypothetical protein GBA52_005461 [Prunus armeniaca]